MCTLRLLLQFFECTSVWYDSYCMIFMAPLSYVALFPAILG